MVTNNIHNRPTRVEYKFSNSGSIMVPNTCLEWDSNMGPKHLSLIEFKTWQLRPLGHHGQFLKLLVILQSS